MSKEEVIDLDHPGQLFRRASSIASVVLALAAGALGQAPSNVKLSPATIVGGFGSGGTVILASAAPAGGLSVTLASDNTSVATVPASVTVAGGATTATFTITTAAVSTTALSHISATTGSGSAMATLSVIPVSSGLAGYWTFDDATGAAAADSSGNNHAAVLVNTPTWVTGQMGGAISANGTNQAVNVPAIDLSSTNVVTVSMWVNRTYSTTGGHVFVENSPNYNSSTTGFGIFPDDNTCRGIQLGIHGNVGYTANCFNQPSSGTWHLITAIFDKSHAGVAGLSLYIDGVLQTSTQTLFSSNNTGNFGNNATYLFSRGGTGEFSSGSLDDVRIYSRALSASEILQLYNLGANFVSLQVTPTNPSITKGATQAFTATGTRSDGTTQNITGAVTWTSSNTAAATISTSGVATGVAAGSTTIQATLGALSNATGLTVTPAVLTSIVVTPAGSALIVGGTQQFTATGTYSDASTQNLTASVSWGSTNTAVATISGTGLATAVANGATTIQATSGAITGSTTLSVAQLVSISVTPLSVSISTGSTQQFTATGTYSNNSTQNLTGSVVWSSSNTAAATISAGGLTTGVAPGTTTVQAVLGALSGTATLTVSNNLPGLVGYWKFDDGTGSTAADSAGSHPAALINNPTWVVGQMMGAISTNGTNQSVNIPAIDLSATNAVSVAFWSNRTYSTTGGDVLIEDSANYNGSATGFGVFPDDPGCGGISVAIHGNVGYSVNCYNQPSSGAWHHLVAIFDKSVPSAAGIKLYIDGAPQTAKSTPLSTNNTNAFGNNPMFAASRGGTSEFAAGALDDLQLYNRALSALDVQQIYNSGTGGAVLTSIAVTPANPSIVTGATQQFTATGTYSNGATLNLTSSATWASSNTGAATIATTGLATAAAPGTTTVSATAGSVTGSTTLTVTAPTLVSIAVTPANSSIASGTALQYTATGTFSNGTTQNLTSTVTWSSSATTVATISAAGLASGLTGGSTTIQATSGSVTGSTQLTVIVTTLVSIAVTPANSSITKASALQYTATGTFSNGTTQNLTGSVAWNSSNTAVVTISSAGLATALTNGSSTIQATSGSVSGSTVLTVVNASYPNVTYDMWVDFEQDTLGAVPTAAQLAASTHGAAGTWDVSPANGLVTTQAPGEDPAHVITGDNGTRGLAYAVSNGSPGYLRWNLPAPQSSLSFGMWYKTAQPAAYVEGPHFVTMYNYSLGNLLRLSDERSGYNNARQIRVSPLDQAVTGISDNTWYWLTFKWTQGGTGTFSVYDATFTLVGSVNFGDTFNAPVQAFLFGNETGTSGEAGETSYFDDFVLDYTHSNFPLLPSPPVSLTLGVTPGTVTGGVQSIGTITLAAAAPAGGATVLLSSSNTAAATVPPSVTVPAGLKVATFPVTTLQVAAVAQVTITGSYLGSLPTANLTVEPVMTQLASDSFGRADAGTLGSNWTPLVTVTNNIGALQIVSHGVRATALSPAVSKELFYGGMNWSSSQYAQAQILAASGNGFVGPAVRVTSNDSQYACVVLSAGSGNASIAIVRVLAGVSTTLANTTTAIARVGDVIRCTAQGSSLVMANQTTSAVLLIATDSAIAGGYPGLVSNAGTGSLASYAVTNFAAGAPAASLPLTLIASDDFNRADSPNLGPNWHIGTGHGPVQIVGQQTQPAPAGGPQPSKEHYVAAGAFPNDQWVQMQVFPTALGDIGAELRASDTADTLYVVDTNLSGGAGTAEVRIAKVINGVITALVIDQQWAAVASGDTVLAQVQGTLITLIDVTTGTLLLSVNDTDIASGYPGLSLQAINGGPANNVADNWSAGRFGQ